MTDEYLTIGSYRNEIDTPKDDMSLIEDLIDQLINLADPIKLLNKEKISILEKIRVKYSSQKIKLLEKIDEILAKVKCQNCEKLYKGKHTCGNLICPTCIKSQNYTCNHCYKQLSHQMIRKFCKKSLSCINCRGKVSSRCGHKCKSCILLNSNNFYESCEACLEYYKKQVQKSVNCLRCGLKCAVLDTFEFCKKHFLCESCSIEQVQTGKCQCGSIVNLQKIKFIYDKTFELCSYCNFSFPKNELKVSEISGKFYCKICVNLNFEVEDDF